MPRYNAVEIEQRWQAAWDAAQAFASPEDSSRPKYYVLEMFPYPSGKSTWVTSGTTPWGTWSPATSGRGASTSCTRWAGTPSACPPRTPPWSAASHPAAWTYDNIDTMRRQLQSMGLSLGLGAGNRHLPPRLLVHQQAMFLKFFEAGLAYRGESLVNWDPVDRTVLANEQVIDGKGWRSGAEVEQRRMAQWFLKITEYSEELTEALTGLERWPDKVRLMQTNWIGRSEGARVNFRLAGRDGEINGEIIGEIDGEIEVFTTRPDTLFGASFCALVAQSSAGAGAGPVRRGARGFHRRMRQARHQRGSHRDRREAGLRYRAEGRASVHRRPPSAGVRGKFRADGIRRRRHLRLSGP